MDDHSRILQGRIRLVKNKRFIVSDIDSCFDCPNATTKKINVNLSLYCDHQTFKRKKRVGDFKKLFDKELEIPSWCPLPDEVWIPKRVKDKTKGKRLLNDVF
jgi:hypothetical protein